LIEIGSKTAEKNFTDRQTNRHYENNGHLAVNQKLSKVIEAIRIAAGEQHCLQFSDFIHRYIIILTERRWRTPAVKYEKLERHTRI